MIDIVKIINVETKKEITIDKNASEYKYVLDSIDWDSPVVESNTYRVPFQVGKTLEGVTIGTRKPSITGYIIADTTRIDTSGITWNEYFEKQKEVIERNKEEMNNLISVYQDVILIADGYYLKARPTQPPKYAIEEQDNNEVLCLFTLEFECYKPLFYSESKIADFARTEKKVSFPLILTEDKKDEYVVFGEIAKRKSVLIENNGDIDVGCVITIKAVGGNVKNISVYNVNTNEKILFYDLTLSDGDSIIIYTDTEKEDVILHDGKTGKERTIIGELDINSILFKILRGKYYYSYDADEDSLANIEMNIEFSEMFFNIRGM